MDQTQQGLGGYQPPEPMGTICLLPPDGGHGMCDTNGTITCDPSFFDCDNSPANGCESQLNDPGNCGACGINCSECMEGATCTDGKCGGKARPDDSACRAAGCTVVGMCHSGVCMCPSDGVDMAHVPRPPHRDPTRTPTDNGNNVPRACSYADGGTAGASLLLILGAILLLFRRRRA